MQLHVKHCYIKIEKPAYCNFNPIEQMIMVMQSGKYLKAYMTNGLAPEYKQKSYGKYKLNKLLMKYI